MRLVLASWVFLLGLSVVAPAAEAAENTPRPSHTEHARLARWLAHMNGWGTLSTQSGCLTDGRLDCASAWCLFLSCCAPVLSTPAFHAGVCGTFTYAVIHLYNLCLRAFMLTHTHHTTGSHGPSTGVVSYADAPPGTAAAGRLFFYLTSMDETGHHVQV